MGYSISAYFITCAQSITQEANFLLAKLIAAITIRYIPIITFELRLSRYAFLS